LIFRLDFDFIRKRVGSVNDHASSKSPIMKQHLVYPSSASFRTLALVAIFSLASSFALAADKKLVVGFAQVGAESGWRTANTESIKSEAAKRGVDLRFSDAQHG
jgi:simple sugar transport system substrate-binding protein